MDSVKTVFHAAWLLLEKMRDIKNSQVCFTSYRTVTLYLTVLQKTTRTCTIVRKKETPHVVDGWAIIMCKECHSGKCFAHILEGGTHSSEALMAVELDKSYRKWHSIHINRQGHYQNAVPSLILAMKLGNKIEIDDRLVHFARTLQTPRPLSKWVSLGFYDQELPDPEEVSHRVIHADCTLILLLYLVHVGGPTGSFPGIRL